MLVTRRASLFCIQTKINVQCSVARRKSQIQAHRSFIIARWFAHMNLFYDSLSACQSCPCPHCQHAVKRRVIWDALAKSAPQLKHLSRENVLSGCTGLFATLPSDTQDFSSLRMTFMNTSRLQTTDQDDPTQFGLAGSSTPSSEGTP